MDCKMRRRSKFNKYGFLTLLFAAFSCIYLSNIFQQEMIAWRMRTTSIRLEERKFQYHMSSKRPEVITKTLQGVENIKILSVKNMEYNKTTLESKPSERRLPRVIIVGVKKCGTRALLEYLRLHPDVRATGPEPHFFDRYYHKGLEWYRSKMPKSTDQQITIEKTPRYFVTMEAPARIHNMSNSTKLILVVRDPVTRAISDFTQSVSKGEYNTSITFRDKAIRRHGEVNAKWSAINIGLYEFHLTRWLSYFSMTNIHIVDGETLIKNPVQELNNVQDFIGLNRNIHKETIYMNFTRGFPCIFKEHSSPSYKCFRNSKGRLHSYVDNETLTTLRQFYKPYNEKFYKLIGKNFHW